MHPYIDFTLVEKLRGSTYGNMEDIAFTTDYFNENIMMTFKNPDESSYIKSGRFQNDDYFNIQRGRLKLLG